MKKCEVVLTVDVQRALDTFPFIRNENVTLLEREEKSHLVSLCDAPATEGSNLCCFWDRHPIEGTIYTCPIRKVYKGEQRTYKSNINGNTYTMRDSLNTDNFYYETDGHFCSVECRSAFLDEEEARNPLFANARQLILAQLGVEPPKAPHWRTLAAYGGALSIQEFRKGLSHKEYILEEMISGHFPYQYRYRTCFRL